MTIKLFRAVAWLAGLADVLLLAAVAVVAVAASP